MVKTICLYLATQTTKPPSRAECMLPGDGSQVLWHHGAKYVAAPCYNTKEGGSKLLAPSTISLFSRLLSSLQPTDRWGVKFNDLVLKRQSGWAGHFAARKRHNPLTWYLIDFLLFVESSSGYWFFRKQPWQINICRWTVSSQNRHGMVRRFGAWNWRSGALIIYLQFA